MSLSSSLARWAFLASATTALLGCATATPAPSHYHWHHDLAHTHQHLREAVPAAEQLAHMQAHVDAAGRAQQPLPPGFWAHVGWLHAQLGQRTEALHAWQREQQQFPESAGYVQTLMAPSGFPLSAP